MRIYVRKYDNQCITHQISVTKDIVKDFFDNAPDHTNLTFKGKNSGKTANVIMLLATDPRFGGNIKNLINDEGGADLDDLLVIYKDKTQYTLEIIKKADTRYSTFFNMYVGTDRHLILNIDEGDGTVKIVLDKDIIKEQFKNWMDSQTNSDGTKAYAPGVISNYLSAINTVSSSLTVTIYEIYNYKTLCDLINSCLSDANFMNDDKVKHHYTLSNGLKAYKKFFEDFLGITDTTIPAAASDPAIKGYNKIYYGAPGCGKSRKVKDILSELGVSKTNQFRVTFHPEYSNFDFVGQVLPTSKTEKIVDPTDPTKFITKTKVEYKFNSGPFVLALEQAFKEQMDGTDRMVYLVIEEINRGNAAAIFGDLFQLLDRDSSGKSEYPITNVNIKGRLDEDGFSSFTTEGVYIPNNLTILATMNTSDQNVFTLDTAFKRRWEFEQVTNTFTAADSNYNKKVPGTSLLWRDFVEVINRKITDPTRTSLSGEDKRIGKYFVKNDYLCDGDTELFTQAKDAAGNITSSVANTSIIEKATSFAYKILEYIWNDVAKFDEKTQWFDVSKNHTLEELIESFINEKDNNPLKVFTGIAEWD